MAMLHVEISRLAKSYGESSSVLLLLLIRGRRHK
jgi:hypothetical protein